MPTYEYRCSKCGSVFELFQNITEGPKRTVAPELKSCDCDAPVTRLLGAGAGVLFKGSGFYETDYRSEEYRKAAKAEKEPPGESKSDATSSDRKPGGGEKSTKKTSAKPSRQGPHTT